MGSHVFERGTGKYLPILAISCVIIDKDMPDSRLKTLYYPLGAAFVIWRGGGTRLHLRRQASNQGPLIEELIKET